MSTLDRPRLYRFAARDRTGWLLGLQAAQCLVLAVGVLVAGLLLNSGAPVPVVSFPWPRRPAAHSGAGTVNHCMSEFR